MDLETNVDVEWVLRVVAELLPCLESLAGLSRTVVGKAVRERDRVERLLGHGGERCDDSEAGTRASGRPKEVRVLRPAGSADLTVCGDNLETRHLVREEPPCTRRETETSLASVAANAHVRAGTVCHGSLTYA